MGNINSQETVFQEKKGNALKIVQYECFTIKPIGRTYSKMNVKHHQKNILTNLRPSASLNQ